MSFNTKKGQATIEKPAVSARTLRGQAAMEYLMTYGWAILVIVIVLVILASFLNLVKTPENCVFSQPGFSCAQPNPLIYSNTSNSNNVGVAIKLHNQQSDGITVSKILCTNVPIADVDDSWGTTFNTAIASGASHEFTVPCKRDVGLGITQAPGTSFQGSLVVWYKYDSDLSSGSGIYRKADARLTGTVLES